MISITIHDITETFQRIKPFIINTPVLESEHIDKLSQSKVFFKCENLQKTGSFKIRGAMNAVLLLDEHDRLKGVASHSSGNHAAALACAANAQNLPAFMVMPDNAPLIKQKAVSSFGAKIIQCAPTMEARENALVKVIRETGAVLVPSYNDNRIIAGQGTASLELLGENPDLDFILAPIGGGGLISGTAITGKAIKPSIKIIGVEPELADDALRSIQAGKIIPSKYPDTIADGLRTSLGDITFPIIQKYVDSIVTVSEQEIINAMYVVWENMKLIIEPSSAVPVAALLYHEFGQIGKRVGVILSGGNVDLKRLPWCNNSNNF